MKRKPRRRIKRKRLNTRNFDDPRYKAWRKAVYKRDGYKCQYPGCRVKKGITAHHIRTWSAHPGLRFVQSNGIVLCYTHHEKITGHEEAYAPIFIKLVRDKRE